MAGVAWAVGRSPVALFVVATFACVAECEARGGEARVGAVQAFETDDRVYLFVALDKEHGTGLDAEWRTQTVTAITITDMSVRHRRSEIGALEHIHPTAVTIFGDDDAVFAHRYAGGRDRLYRWGDDGPEPLGETEATELAFRAGLVLTTPAAAVKKLKAFRESNGWKELPAGLTRVVGSNPSPPLKRLTPSAVRAVIELRYDRRTVHVTLAGGMTEEVEIQLEE